MFTTRRAYSALICCIFATWLATSAFADTTPTATTPSSTGTVQAVPNTVQINQIRKEKQLRRKLINTVQRLHKDTWHWQDSALRRRTSAGHVYKVKSTSELQKLVRKWRNLKERSRFIALHPPNESAWACIHSHEASSWSISTGNGYYGGLQMDKSFQRTYGYKLYARKGTANNWTWYEQMHVADRARRSGRGFYPWPLTARACGLI